MTERYSSDRPEDRRRRALELKEFNGMIGQLISGEIEPLGDEMIPVDNDEPDGGGQLAILGPENVPPRISRIALRRPGQEPLVDLVTV